MDFHVKGCVKWLGLKLIHGVVPMTFSLSTAKAHFLDHRDLSPVTCQNLQRENLLGFYCTMNEMRHALTEEFGWSKDSSDVRQKA